MKGAIQLCFHSVISNEVAEWKNYKHIAEKAVRYLNSDLGDKYPDDFYYLKAKIKGGYQYYAGSIADPSQWDDPKFLKVIEPDYEPQPNPGRTTGRVK